MTINGNNELDPKLKAQLNKYIDQRIVDASRQVYDAVNRKIKTVESKVQEIERNTSKNRAAIIASKGTLDMAYPPLLLATGARSMGIESSIFFTLYGVNILKKKANLKVAPVANPAMPIPIPNIKELLEMARGSGVNLVACQMTLDVLGIKKKDLIEGVEFGGLATFLEYGMGATVTLFI
jgi:peroxiredoxin family protein